MNTKQNIVLHLFRNRNKILFLGVHDLKKISNETKFRENEGKKSSTTQKVACFKHIL